MEQVWPCAGIIPVKCVGGNGLGYGMLILLGGWDDGLSYSMSVKGR